jgi:hypothetical protein
MTGYSTNGDILWPGTPDWSQAPTETLAFATDVQQAAAGAQLARALLDAPRRTFAFQQVFGPDESQLADAVLERVGQGWLWLPIFPDAYWLPEPIDAGSTSIFLDTTGRDFAVGARVALYADIGTWELATIAALDASHLELTGPTQNAWGVGARLFPVRRARLTDAAKGSYLNDVVSTLSATLEIDEACAWPAAFPTAAVYRTQPVLEWRNEESEDPTGEYDRLASNVDNGLSAPYLIDIPGVPFRAQSQRFALQGRAQHAAFRSLLYALNGREAACWVPSWLADARLTAPAAANATTLTIANVGITVTGGPRMNRQDLAIELYDGTHLYRRVTAASAAGAAETLTLDSAPGVALTPGNVRAIGWLRLCALASDTVQIQHITDADGAGVATLAWQAVQHAL